MRYRVIMTIDIEEVEKNARVNKAVAPVVPEEPKLIPPPPLTQLTYGIKEVAKVLGIGRSSVYYLMNNPQPRCSIGHQVGDDSLER